MKNISLIYTNHFIVFTKIIFIFSPAAAQTNVKCLCAGIWKVESRIRLKDWLVWKVHSIHGCLNSTWLETADWIQSCLGGTGSVSKQLLSVWILKLPQRRFRAFAFAAISSLLCQMGNHSEAPFLNIPSTKQMNKKARSHLWGTKLKCTVLTIIIIYFFKGAL